MRRSKMLARIGVAATLAAPALALAQGIGEPPEGKYTIAVDFGSHKRGSDLMQRGTNRSGGETLIAVGAIVLVAGLGSGGGVSQALILGAGGFLIGLGVDNGPAVDPWHTGLTLGYWHGKPTANYTLFRF